MIGKINKIPIDQVVENEAFVTKTLVDNLDDLSEAVGLNLTNACSEQKAGNFRADILAVDEESGSTVVIENQLYKSDHDHLGKILTYLSNLDAKIAIWIVGDPRPEHINAIGWLNETRLSSFYLVKLEAIKINESEPAFLFTLIVGPSEEVKEIGETKEEISDGNPILKKFWIQLLQKAKLLTKLHSSRGPSSRCYLWDRTGVRGLHWGYYIRKSDSHVELYIDRGSNSDEENKEIFEQLKKNKEEIESVLGPLSWERLDDKRACRIIKLLPDGGHQSDESKWSSIQDKMIEAMIQFEKVVAPFVNKLSI
ncbi:MAG: DUF4268 domain-containing protein [Oligoflexia bacterium]|nr:DUF4268 domain-containing protein [Oligoflexia bacterium]